MAHGISHLREYTRRDKQGRKRTSLQGQVKFYTARRDRFGNLIRNSFKLHTFYTGKSPSAAMATVNRFARLYQVEITLAFFHPGNIKIV